MIASAASVFHLPERMSFTEGAAFGMAYGTSYHALVQQGEISPGKVVLVLGAGGGTGIAAVQIAKALGGLVIAAASSPEKLALAQASGADHAIDYLNRDLKQSVKDLTDGAGANIIYDPIGGALAEAAMRSIAWGGRYLVVGFASGTIPAIPINLALIKSAGIIGVFWGAWVDRAPILNRRNFENLSRLFSEGLLRPPISQEIELEDVPAALRAMLNRELQGKTVIRFPAR
ncbi:MAG: NADPH:quinone oxidoreductase family protein [Sphingomonadaceae bacterium]